MHEIPDPQAGGGEVVVEVLATCVPPYANEVFSGERRYPLEPPPVVPGVGGIGRVVAAGPDATKLRLGDLVWCDTTVRARDEALTPDITLQGWSPPRRGRRTPGPVPGRRIVRRTHAGAHRERLPTARVR
ncbi:alcohol dehydrogenase catalytic domain-containing protein [Lentzea flava]|uniref:alcohol dehydrogenase catalytic domain-containing protein n=1 Tax=Lentzea flava TaxID=103732 RepID=UPI0027E0C629|nr:alcohol dehydrogenase catalytic domain-containing protein [Lentzea flava]